MWFSRLRKLAWNQKQVGFDKLPNIQKKRHKILNIVRKYSTPLFIADREILTNRVEKLKNLLLKHWGNNQIAYSFKTNYEIAKLYVFKEAGFWAEVVSGKEYQMAKKLGYKGSQIIFNGPYKRESELSLALKDGASVNIDNFEELERIIKIVKSKRVRLHVGIRVNTEIPYIQTSRFGFSIDSHEAKLAIKKLTTSKNLSLTNLHIHIGTDVDNTISYQMASRKVCQFIAKNIPDYQNTIKSLDFGGGFPAHGLASYGRRSWNPKPIEAYVVAISKELSKVFNGGRPTLILEPGRYLVDDAVIFITKIINAKYERGQQILTTDATATMLPLIYYRPQIVKLFNNNLIENKSPLINSVVYGASCKEDDLLYSQKLPKTAVNNFLVFFVTGAYNQNMASEFIFRKPNLYTI